MGSGQVIVLDTHAWIWWVNDPSQLSEPARRTIETAMAKQSLYVSSISAWELTMLVQRKRIHLSLDVRDWISRCEALPFLSFIPIDNAITVESVRLPEFPHADPADRIIVATALSLGAQLVTKDEKLHAYPYVKVVW